MKYRDCRRENGGRYNYYPTTTTATTSNGGGCIREKVQGNKGNQTKIKREIQPPKGLFMSLEATNTNPLPVFFRLNHKKCSR